MPAASFFTDGQQWTITLTLPSLIEGEGLTFHGLSPG
jgi:hypothetical protein